MVKPAVPFHGLRFRIFESEFSNPIEPEVTFRHFAHTMRSMLINKVASALGLVLLYLVRFDMTFVFVVHETLCGVERFHKDSLLLALLQVLLHFIKFILDTSESSDKFKKPSRPTLSRFQPHIKVSDWICINLLSS